MPDDRFIHKRAGHSEKVNLLTDLEYRVWTQYILSADDFGVMRASAVTVQADNDHLSNRPAKVIQRCIEALAKPDGLLRTFEHQRRSYIYQHDWQSWQKVAYPRQTNNPKPPADALALCDELTQRLFAMHPGGAGRKRGNGSGNVPETVGEHSPLTRVGAPAERLTAKANGERQEANGAQPIIRRRRLDAAFEHECGIYLPQRAHDDFAALHPGEDLFAWFMSVCSAWAGRNTGADMFKFWKARADERWPPEQPAQSSRPRPAWTQKPAGQAS